MSLFWGELDPSMPIDELTGDVVFIDSSNIPHQVDTVYYNIGGSNKLVWQRKIELEIPSYATAYFDVVAYIKTRNLLGAENITITNPVGQIVPSLVFKNKPSNWSITFINKGEIQGGPAGHALFLQTPITVINNMGKIKGGGGHGGQGGRGGNSTARTINYYAKSSIVSKSYSKDTGGYSHHVPQNLSGNGWTVTGSRKTLRFKHANGTNYWFDIGAGTKGGITYNALSVYIWWKKGWYSGHRVNEYRYKFSITGGTRNIYTYTTTSIAGANGGVGGSGSIGQHYKNIPYGGYITGTDGAQNEKELEGTTYYGYAGGTGGYGGRGGYWGLPGISGGNGGRNTGQYYNHGKNTGLTLGGNSISGFNTYGKSGSILGEQLINLWGKVD